MAVSNVQAQQTPPPAARAVDEQADSAVRKAVLYFGPSGHNPRLFIGFRCVLSSLIAVEVLICSFRNEVDVDAGGRIKIVDSLEDYRSSVREPTWNAVHKYAKILREKHIKIAFFSSTPQGGGVALMRHALIRLFRLLGVDAKWVRLSANPDELK